MTNASPRDILGEKEYLNYRNVRAAAVMFIIMGVLFALGGVANLVDHKPTDQSEPHPGFFILFVVSGTCGAVGGAATLSGNRRLAKLSYVMACVYALLFPIGTIMSYVLLKGMSSYLHSVEVLAARTRGA